MRMPARCLILVAVLAPLATAAVAQQGPPRPGPGCTAQDRNARTDRTEANRDSREALRERAEATTGREAQEATRDLREARRDRNDAQRELRDNC